jgi:hypothetical protein
MTELDTTALRQALRASQDPGDLVDVTKIMTRGRRLRNRRRLAAVAGTVCAVALLAGTASAIADRTAGPSQRVQPVGPAREQSLQPTPAGRHAPHPVTRPTADLPATPVPLATPLPATATPTASATPTPSASATTTPTSAALPSPSSLPTAR